MIDKNEIRRERSNLWLNEKTYVSNELSSIESIKFDRRKDETLVNGKRGEMFHKEMIKENYITPLSEPENNFLGHVAIDRGTSQIKTNAIENFLSESNICTKQIKAVGCDQLL